MAGGEINGTVTGDFYGNFLERGLGYSLDVSSDGMTLVAATWGFLRVFQYSGGEWGQVGSDIAVIDVLDQYAGNIHLTTDGKVTFGVYHGTHPYADDWGPTIRTLQLSDQSLTDVCSTPNDAALIALAVSKNGKTIVHSDLSRGLLARTLWSSAGDPAWNIIFVGLDADFGVDSTDKIELQYDISATWDYETDIFLKDCSTRISDIQFNQTNITSPRDALHESLTLSYSFDKSGIASSVISNETTSQIEFCQVVRLILPQDGAPDF